MKKALVSRREFVTAALACAAAAGVRNLWADPLGLPPGLQLYSVRDLLPKDYAGTLRQLGALGYREVEAAGFYGHTAAEVRQAMDQAGLRCVSAHYALADLKPALDATIVYGQALGLQFIVCSSPMPRNPPKGASWLQTMSAMTLEDWWWNADQFNQIGQKVKAAGMQFAYHNHL